MREFKLDFADVDAQAIRIVQKLAPQLTDEHPAHVAATLVLMLASYITILSKEADVDGAEVDAMIDKMIVKVRAATRLQRAHYTSFVHPGNA